MTQESPTTAIDALIAQIDPTHSLDALFEEVGQTAALILDCSQVLLLATAHTITTPSQQSVERDWVAIWGRSGPYLQSPNR